MKIALGMIVPYFRVGKKLMSFIENAHKYGHELDSVIVAYSSEYNEAAGQRIREKADFSIIDIKNPDKCISQLRERGISEKSINTLTQCPIKTNNNNSPVPYGFNRMMVVMEAILSGADVLIFVDSDVECAVLTKTPEGDKLQEIDFFGEHLRHIKNGIEVTTGEYSGYNILPHASFDGMEDLLYGVKKINVLDYWKTSNRHKCLTYQPPETIAQPCNKILGGNLALKLSVFAKLPPFFSSYYTVDDEYYLCRGEDTVLGFEMDALGIKCMDIGVYPLHDTYGDYPAEPDLINDKKVQDRLFYACTGWVGRNPFFNHIIGKDPIETREFQREHLVKGIKSLVKHTGYPRYNHIIKCFDVSWGNLNRYVDEFESVKTAWEDFKKGTGLSDS